MTEQAWSPFGTKSLVHMPSQVPREVCVCRARSLSLDACRCSLQRLMFCVPYCFAPQQCNGYVDCLAMRATCCCPERGAMPQESLSSTRQVQVDCPCCPSTIARERSGHRQSDACHIMHTRAGVLSCAVLCRSCHALPVPSLCAVCT
jgi:hypothetical protein